MKNLKVLKFPSEAKWLVEPPPIIFNNAHQKRSYY